MMSIRRRPQFDGLEFRTVPSTLSGVDPSLLAGPTYALQASSPDLASSVPPAAAPLVSFASASGRPTLEGSTAVAVTFDASVDLFALSFPDLVLTRMPSASNPDPVVVAGWAYHDPSDPTGARGIFQLAAPLSPGTYRVSMRDGTALFDMAGNPLTSAANPAVATFTVADTAPQPRDAADLGNLGGSGTMASGDVDLAAGPAGSRLFRITLPAGGSWDLALNVSAQADGGSLDAALTLLDADGRPIRFEDGGSSASPLDPEIRARLAGGTYYALVSGSSTDGGTDGSFRLRAAARPASEAARVSLAGVVPLHANPLSDQATGLLLNFSGAVDPKSFGVASGSALALVDASGRSWPLIPAGFTPDRASAAFGFTSEVPAGTYTIVVDPGATPADAVGQPLVGPGGSATALGTITIAAPARTTPDDFGPLWADAEARLALAPGASATRTFTVLADGADRFTLQGDVASARIVVRDLQGNEVAAIAEGTPAGASANSYRSWLLNAPAGTYSVTVFNDSDRPVELDLKVAALGKLAESLLNVGIGQSAGVGSRVMGPFLEGVGAPASILARPAPASGPAGTSPDAGQASNAAEVGLLATHEAGDSAASPEALAGDPAGRPGVGFDEIGAVGQAGMGRPVAIALNRAIQAARPLGQGETLGNGLNTLTNPVGQGRSDGRTGPDGRLADPGLGDGIAVTEGMGQAIRDGQALAASIPIDGLTLASWARSEAEAAARDGIVTPDGVVLITPDGPTDFSRATPEDASLTTEYATLSPPVVVIGSLFAAYRARLGIRRWARRTAQAAHAILDACSGRR